MQENTDAKEQYRSWRRKRLLVRAVLAALGFMGVAAAGAWWYSHPSLASASEMVQCRAWYDRATTAADTARVDNRIPGRTTPQSMSCGALRRSDAW